MVEAEQITLTVVMGVLLVAVATYILRFENWRTYTPLSGGGGGAYREGAEVSHVHDDFPLYHRNWKDIFSELGLAQLLREPTKRDTIRVFRVL